VKESNECPFCAIAQGPDPSAREVYRDEHVVAFFPLEPATQGHTLIRPRNHVPDLWALTKDDAAHLARATLRVSHGLRSALRPEGLNVIQSNGEAATQTVMHTHIHLVPRWENDEMGAIWPEGTSQSQEDQDDALRLVRESLWGSPAMT
jgi:histidine triad (HIT) family protein